MYSVSIFYFTFYSFGGCVYAPNAFPCLRAWGTNRVASGVTNLNIPVILGESRRFGEGEILCLNSLYATQPRVSLSLSAVSNNY